MSPYLIGSVLYGDDDRVAFWVRQRIRNAIPQDAGQKHCALGVVQGGRFVGGVVFYNYRGHDIEVAAAFDSVTWARPETLRELFRCPFVELGCVRATATTGRRNKRVRKLLEHLGCKLEGVKRKGLDGKEDAIVYGLLRSECRFLGG